MTIPGLRLKVSAASKNRNPAQKHQICVSEWGITRETPEKSVCNSSYSDINRDTIVWLFASSMFPCICGQLASFWNYRGTELTIDCPSLLFWAWVVQVGIVVVEFICSAGLAIGLLRPLCVVGRWSSVSCRKAIVCAVCSSPATAVPTLHFLASPNKGANVHTTPWEAWGFWIGAEVTGGGNSIAVTSIFLIPGITLGPLLVLSCLFSYSAY